jgi:hypothetical protein
MVDGGLTIFCSVRVNKEIIVLLGFNVANPYLMVIVRRLDVWN